MIKFKSAKVERWVVLMTVSLVGGIITKLPYLKDTYYSTLEVVTGTTKAQLGMLLTMYGLMNFVCYFPGGMLADKNGQEMHAATKEGLLAVQNAYKDINNQVINVGHGVIGATAGIS